MWQEIIVGIIGICVIFAIGRRMYNFFVKAKRKENCCAGCNGCKIKEELLKGGK